jgi:hypothetical protein
MMWNPYTVKPTPPARVAIAHDFPQSTKQATGTEAQNNGNYGLSFSPVAETAPPQASVQPPSEKDPLWYLHALPPADANGTAITTDLKTLAAQDAKLQAALRPATAEVKTPVPPAISTSRSLMREIKDGFKSLPSWLIILSGVFMGGIGIFTLVGGLVLLKVLFAQARPQLFTLPTGALFNEAQGAVTAGPSSGIPPSVSQSMDKTLRGNRLSPHPANRYGFEDKSSVSALDYLKESSHSVPQAVHNAVLVKFPTSKKHRSGLKQKATRPASGFPTYSARP